MNARDISKLRMREDKAWAVLDYYLRPLEDYTPDQRKEVTSEVRTSAAKFVLERMYAKLNQYQDDSGTPIKPLLVIHHPDSKPPVPNNADGNSGLSPNDQPK